MLRRRAQKSRRDESILRDGRKEMENLYIYIYIYTVCNMFRKRIIHYVRGAG